MQSLRCGVALVSLLSLANCGNEETTPSTTTRRQTPRPVSAISSTASTPNSPKYSSSWPSRSQRAEIRRRVSNPTCSSRDRTYPPHRARPLAIARSRPRGARNRQGNTDEARSATPTRWSPGVAAQNPTRWSPGVAAQSACRLGGCGLSAGRRARSRPPSFEETPWCHPDRRANLRLRPRSG